MCFYFVHSYYCYVFNKSSVYGSLDYGDLNCDILIENNNIFACQFHPEKSADAGLRLLRNFIECSV